MKLSAIVACDHNGGIGKDNTLPWHFKEDFKHFVAETKGKTVLMGRKTFESLPSGPLPNRHNVVVTRDTSFKNKGVEVVHDLEGWIESKKETEDEIMVIGGADIYHQLGPKLDEFIITRIFHEYDCDTFLDVNRMREHLDHRSQKTLPHHPGDPMIIVSYYGHSYI